MSGSRSLDGVLLVDKPAGITSAGVVREIKRRLDVAKVGHLGTLDPFATGLLPLAVGVRIVHHPDPTDAGRIVRKIAERGGAGLMAQAG